MASEKLEAIVWRDLGAAPDAAALGAFIEEFPDGTRADDARAKLEALQRIEANERTAKEKAAKELAAWNAVKDTTDSETLAAFLADWPDGPHAAEARRLKKALHGGLVTGRTVLAGAGAVAIIVAIVTGFSTVWLDRMLVSLPDSSLRTF
jgi:hypothetical protein